MLVRAVLAAACTMGLMLAAGVNEAEARKRGKTVWNTTGISGGTHTVNVRKRGGVRGKIPATKR